MESIIHKKIDIVTDILESEEYKTADKLMKRVAKMKEDIKKYCQETKVTNIETEKSKVFFHVRKQNRLDATLLDPELVDKATKETQVWYCNYEKI